MDGTLTEAGTAAKPEAADLLDWYDRHARRLPWRVPPADRRRGATADPYRVWLSEVMLQQTTVKAVAPYFAAFLERWPDVASLAAAEDRDVMAAWAGLGYYSRARNLIACAREVAAEHGGRFPARSDALARLPGIGAYTSAAIAAIAFRERAAVVDGNVERVVARLFAIATPLPAAKAEIRACVAEMVPADRPGEFAEALMDLGATICTPKAPACALCPWRLPCAARASGRQAAFPVKAPRRERPTRYGHAFVARRADGAILLRQRPPMGLLGGMAEVPGSHWGESEAAAPAPPLPGRWREAGLRVEHVFTHFRLLLTIHHAEIADGAGTPADHWWAAQGRLAREALPSVMKKVIEAAYPGATRPVPTQAASGGATEGAE